MNRGRSIVWLLAVSTGCIVANIYYVQPLLADMAGEFGLSAAQTGISQCLRRLAPVRRITTSQSSPCLYE